MSFNADPSNQAQEVIFSRKLKLKEIFNLNPIIVIIKALNHLLSATEVKTSRNGVKTKHVKILMAL